MSGKVRTVIDMSLTQAELNEIKERAENATPGPWVKTFATGIEIVCDFGMKIISDDSGVIRYSDAEFITNAREDIPRLVAEIEWLREGLTYLTEAHHFDSPGQMAEVAEYYLNGGDEE